MSEAKNVINIIKLLVSGFFVIVIALAISFLFNEGLAAQANDNSGILRLESEYASKKEALLKETEEALKNAENADQDAALKYTEALALKEKLEKQEDYYDYYTKNNHKNTMEKRDYHYYGQYYEMFNNVYNANVIFLGSSRSVYGINPFYLENKEVKSSGGKFGETVIVENEELADYSFYNFSLNAAGPSFYQKWYDVFKNEAKYPTPDVLIYCVDWFMFDSGEGYSIKWMWRNFDTYDTASKGALSEIRKYMESRKSSDSLKKELIPLADITTTEATGSIVTDEPIKETTPNTSDKTPEKAPMSIGEYLIALWNGEKKLNLAPLAEKLTTNIPLFKQQDQIPEMINYFLGGSSATSKDLIAKRTEELEAELDELRSNLESILQGGGSYPEVVIPDYYNNRDFCVDVDGNISSKFYKGFIPWEYKYYHVKDIGNPEKWNDSYKEETPRKINSISEKEVEAFKSLIREMQDDGIEVIFMQVPDYEGDRPNDQIAEYTALIQDIAEELGVEFYDYNNSTSTPGYKSSINKKYYSNWNHFNEEGAKVFTQALAKELVDILANSAAKK